MKKIKLAKILVQGVFTVAFAGGIVIYTQAQVKPQEVYVFSRDIPVNTVIQSGDLTKKYIPSDAVTPDMIVNIDEVVGKAVITKSFPGQYVIKQQLVNADETDPLEDMDLTNYRKVSVEISSEDAIGGNIKKGDRVDLLAVREGERSGETAVESKIFMQDVLVYSVIDENGLSYVDKSEGNSIVLNDRGETVESGGLAIITFAVTAQQAEEIELRKNSGEFKVIGRFKDSIDVTTPGKVIIPNEI